MCTITGIPRSAVCKALSAKKGAVTKFVTARSLLPQKVQFAVLSTSSRTTSSSTTSRVDFGSAIASTSSMRFA
jgi:hypothetical protein